MAITWANEGSNQLCGIVVGFITYTPAIHLGLYNTNTTPLNTMTYASIAATLIEPTDASYARAALTGASWTGGTPASGDTTYSYAQQTFTFSGTPSETIYGYFLYMVINSVSYLWVQNSLARATPSLAAAVLYS